MKRLIVPPRLAFWAMCLGAWCSFGLLAQAQNSPIPNLVQVAQDLSMADVDQNGLADLLAVGAYDDSLGVWLNPNPGANDPPGASSIRSFSVGLNSGPGNDLPRALAIGDFDGDRRPDVAVACSGYPAESEIRDENWKRSSVAILLGRPGGDFSTVQTLEIPPINNRKPFCSSLLAADFNGDGYLDLVAGNRRSNSFCPLRGDGWGKFSRLNTITLPGGDEGVRALEHLEGERGDVILILTERHLYQAVLLESGGSEWSVTQPIALPVRGGTEFTSMARGDYDGDGEWDIAVGDELGGVILLMNWEAYPRPPQSLLSIYRPELGEVISVASGDWRGLGHDDVIAVDHRNGAFCVLDPAAQSLVHQGPLGVAPRKAILADWRRRGIPDLLAADEAEASAPGSSSDIVWSANPGRAPNGLNAINTAAPRLSEVLSNPVVGIGFYQGLACAAEDGAYWLAAPDRGALLKVQSTADGVVCRTPAILASINTRAAQCLYPTGAVLDPATGEWLVVSSGSNRLYRFSPEGAPLEALIINNYDPGASGFWGVAIRKQEGAPSSTILLAAPDRRAIIEAGRDGVYLRALSTNDFPPLSLAYDSISDRALFSHPRWPGCRTLALASTPSPRENEGIRDVMLSWLGVSRVDGVAARPSVSSTGAPQTRIFLLADGHLAELAFNPQYPNVWLTPRVLCLEGLPGQAAYDPESGKTYYSLGRPFPRILEFSPGAACGEAWRLRRRGSDVSGSFNPGPLSLNPQNHELCVASKDGSQLLRISLSTHEAAQTTFLYSSAQWTHDSGPPVGLFVNPQNQAIHLVFANAIAQASASGGDTPPPETENSMWRFSLSHPVSSIAPTERRVWFYCARDGWLFASNPSQGAEAEPENITSLLPLVPNGQQPSTVVFSTSNQSLLALFQGDSPPITLATFPETAARPIWSHYE